VIKVEKKLSPNEKYPYHAYLTENWDMYFPFPCGKLSIHFATYVHCTDFL
jgi:hypothetical protein